MKQLNHLLEVAIDNPKTTLGAIVILSATAAHFMGKIDRDSYLSILGLAGAWIGLAAKDGKKPSAPEA